MDLDEISIEPSSNLSHEQTPVGGASSVPQDESRGLNEMTAEDLNSFKKQVCEYARKDKWKEAESIFNKYADMVCTPLTGEENIALHVAVRANRITFVRGLVNLMTPQDLEIQNIFRETAFLMAAKSGNSDLVEIMIEKNENLPFIKSTHGVLPVFWAATNGHHKMVQDLSSKTLLQNMDIKDIEELFFLTIRGDMFDVATKLFDEYPAIFVIATYGWKHETALEMLLQKPSKELNKIQGNNRGASWGESLQILLKKVWLQLKRRFKSEDILPLGDRKQLVQKIWRQLETQLKSEDMERLKSELLAVLFNILESGNNDEAVKLIPLKHAELLFNTDPRNGQSILHYAVRKRRNSIVNYIFDELWGFESRLETADSDGNNILHLAAYPLETEKTSSTLRPTTKMTRDVKWFKEIEKKAHPKLRTMKNGEGKIPMDVFHDEHNELSKEINDTAKGIADSGMLVAALVATVAFAAALVVPGDKTNPSFTVFILANAAALFTSSACILFSLSNFPTLKFADREFVIALHPSLILERILIHVSIVTLIISFAAASFLIFEHTSKWVAYVVTSLGIFTIVLCLLFQSSLFYTFLWSRFYRL